MKIIKKLEIWFLIFLISGCTLTVATKPEKEKFTYHEVKQGETLFRISKYYYDGNTTQEILEGVKKIKEANNLKDDILSVGQKLKIPETNKKQPLYPLLPPTEIKKPEEKTQTNTSRTKEEKKLEIKENFLIWPVDKGNIICKFGELGNKGIDIMVEPGIEVKASGNGEIVFAGITKKYDETIIIKHSPTIYTVYAHDIEIKVKNGDRVKQGDVIGRVKTGSQKKRYIHFEVIIDGSNVDPLKYLISENGNQQKRN